MFPRKLPVNFFLITCLFGIAQGLAATTARAQMPEVRPLTPQEAQRELADFKDGYKNAYVHLTPGAQVTLDSGVVVTVTSARVVANRLSLTGTIRNATSTATPRGDYNLLLLESFEFQVAKYQKVPVQIGSCGGPCVNSYNPMSVKVPRLAPGQSMAYTAHSTDFARTFPNAKASDMIVVLHFFQK